MPLPTRRDVQETGHGLYPRVGSHFKNIEATHQLLSIARRGNPIGDNRALTMADLTLAMHSYAGHEALRRASVCRQVRQTLQQAEAIAKTNIRGRDPREFGVTSLVVRDGPSLEPSIH